MKPNIPNSNPDKAKATNAGNQRIRIALPTAILQLALPATPLPDDSELNHLKAESARAEVIHGPAAPINPVVLVDSCNRKSLADHAELDQLKAESARLKSTMRARRAAKALEVVTAACNRGVLPMRNETLKAKWLSMCESDPTLIDLLEAMPGHPALTSGRLTSPPPQP